MFASYAEGPLILAGMFVLETLKRHGRYNRKTLEYVVSQELRESIRPSGELVIEGLIRRGPDPSKALAENLKAAWSKA